MHDDLIADLLEADGGSPELDLALFRVAAGSNAQAVRVPLYSFDPRCNVADAAGIEAEELPDGRWRARAPGREWDEAATEALARRVAELRRLAAEGEG